MEEDYKIEIILTNSNGDKTINCEFKYSLVIEGEKKYSINILNEALNQLILEINK